MIGGALVETPGRRGRCGDGELVELQGRQAGGDTVLTTGFDVAEAGPSRNRELRLVVQSRIVKDAGPMHLEVGDEGVPVGHAAPTGVGVHIDAREAKCRRDQRGCCFAVGPEGLAIEK